MLFNTLDFSIFLPIVFVLYWFATKQSLKLQNFFVVLASYVFYGWWDWRFLFLIFFSTTIDYFIGRCLLTQENILKRKLLLWTSIVVNLGFLGFFKYYNFFLDNFVSAFSFMGTKISTDSSINIILPVGISFYTFQTLSYSIDVYKRKLEPTKDFVAFAAFVSFFPQLVAGPIERAKDLLPQFYVKRQFDYFKAVDGMRQILWGLFKKVVIADNCAVYANQIFNNSTDHSGSSLLVGALFFTFQIYGDFSGYSDIAIGTSRLFGFNLKRNFHFPYFSRDIAEFWRSWHISLSTWFRDYLYIPLGGSRGSSIVKIRNVFVIFLVSGFWHGANWTFVAWGFINAIYFLPLLLVNSNRQNMGSVSEGRLIPKFKDLFFMSITFFQVVLAWIIFRADDLYHAWAIFLEIFSTSLFTAPTLVPKTVVLLILVFLLIEWVGRDHEYAIEKIGRKWLPILRWSFYILLFSMLFIFSSPKQEFIYFQF